MRHVAKVLGLLLLALGGVWGLFALGLLLRGQGTNAMGSAVLAGVFALPGFLLYSIARTTERRLRAEEIVRKRDRFTIEEVARELGTPPEQAHVYIADQIARHGLPLAYQQDTRGYARRGLPPPPPPSGRAVAPVSTAPCPSCGSTAPLSEAGFCPTCGAKR